MEGGTQGQELSMGRSTVTESRKVLTPPPHSLSKAGAYGYRHDGYGNGPGWCATTHLPRGYSQYMCIYHEN